MITYPNGFDGPLHSIVDVPKRIRIEGVDHYEGEYFVEDEATSRAAYFCRLVDDAFAYRLIPYAVVAGAEVLDHGGVQTWEHQRDPNDPKNFLPAKMIRFVPNEVAS